MIEYIVCCCHKPDAIMFKKAPIQTKTLLLEH